MRQTTYRTNAALLADVAFGMQRDGYGIRGRSRWLCEQIGELIRKDPALETVSAGEALDEFPLYQSIQVDETTDELIERAYHVVRSIDPMADGIQGALIRAAIRRAVPGGASAVRAAGVAGPKRAVG